MDWFVKKKFKWSFNICPDVFLKINKRETIWQLLENIHMCVLCFQVLNHLHKKLKNVSKKSELSKKKVGGSNFLLLLIFH